MRGYASCGFDGTTPLGEAYAPIGVHFAGPAPDKGGAVLQQCAHFGVPARSRHQYLAFNGSTYAIAPETISFDQPKTGAALWVATGHADTSRFTLTAYRNGDVVDRARVTTQTVGWTQLTVSATDGIDTVVLGAVTHDGNTFVVDDLTYSS